MLTAVTGIPVKSTSSRRKVLATEPISAAVAAMGMELLNIIENLFNRTFHCNYGSGTISLPRLL